MALVPASAISWQTPHFLMKSTRPRAVSAVLVPQPEAASARAARTASASRGRMRVESFVMCGAERAGVYMPGPPEKGLMHAHVG